MFPDKSNKPAEPKTDITDDENKPASGLEKVLEEMKTGSKDDPDKVLETTDDNILVNKLKELFDVTEYKINQ